MIDPKGVAVTALESARAAVKFPSEYKLLRTNSYPNETVFKFWVGFENYDPVSFCFFDVLVSVDNAGNVSRCTAIDPAGKEHPALNDDIVYPFFDRRDTRKLYYRDLFYTALRL